MQIASALLAAVGSKFAQTKTFLYSCAAMILSLTPGKDAARLKELLFRWLEARARCSEAKAIRKTAEAELDLLRLEVVRKRVKMAPPAGQQIDGNFSASLPVADV